MEELTDAEHAELATDLHALAAELDALLASSTGANTVELDQSKVGRLSRIDALQQQSMAVEERRRRQIRKQQVAAAIAAVGEGTYGDCRRCGEPIGYRRLKAKPESPFCVPCTGQLERR